MRMLTDGRHFKRGLNQRDLILRLPFGAVITLCYLRFFYVCSYFINAKPTIYVNTEPNLL